MPTVVEAEGQTRKPKTVAPPATQEPDVATLAVARAASIDDMSQFEAIEAPALKRDLPLINARVVYLGGNPNRSVALSGHIAVESFQVAVPVSAEFPDGVKDVTREAVKPDGITSYDFTLRDTLGRLITQRLMPSTSPHAGRIWAVVKHPMHIHRFFRMRDASGAEEFAVLVAGEHRKAMEEFIFRQERAEKGLAQEIEDTVKQ